mgnify:CR=1 FL=1
MDHLAQLIWTLLTIHGQGTMNYEISGVLQ